MVADKNLVEVEKLPLQEVSRELGYRPWERSWTGRLHSFASCGCSALELNHNAGTPEDTTEIKKKCYLT